MLKAFKYRLYPNEEQQVILSKTFGCCRKVYNHCLDFKNNRYSQFKQHVSRYELSAMLTFLKSTEEYSYLNEVNSQALQSELVYLDKAFTNFFHSKFGYPKFKSKKSRQSFSCPQHVSVNFKEQTIKFPKIKKIKVVIHRTFKGNVKTCTVSKTLTNKYFVSLLIDDGLAFPKKKIVIEKNSIGIDVGLKTFLCDSSGGEVSNPTFYRKNELRIKVLQRRLSRKVKGSFNRKKAKLLLARKHEKIVNCRLNFLHQVSAKLIKNHDTVFVEDLDIKRMLKNNFLTKAISDVGWAEFFRQLTYKSDWHGKNVIKIGRFEPSSKMCGCGVVNAELSLSDRKWVCKSCGFNNDRDFLASKNIKKFGLLGLEYHTRTDGSGEPVELSALAEALKQENATSDGRNPRL